MKGKLFSREINVHLANWSGGAMSVEPVSDEWVRVWRADMTACFVPVKPTAKAIDVVHDYDNGWLHLYDKFDGVV
jgi:uncharacterized protein YfaA (DUF2138 family)